MGTISVNSAGNFKCAIRTKSKKMFATFSDRETAELWCKYHEEINNTMQNFQVKPENMVTLGESAELKVKAVHGKVDRRTIQEIENIKNEWPEIIDLSLNEISNEMIESLANNKLNSLVRHGGSKNNQDTGKLVVSSPSTVLRKLRTLACVFSFMIEKGADIANPVQNVISRIKEITSKD